MSDAEPALVAPAADPSATATAPVTVPDITPELGGIDTTMLSSAQRTELRESNQAQLKQMEDRVPTEVVEALRPRAAELRKQNLALVGARLKAAGM